MKRTDSEQASFPIRAVQGEGGVSFPVFPVINDDPSAFTTPADGIAPLVLGQHVVDKHGHSYIYVRAGAALAVGQVVTLFGNITEAAVQATDATANNIQVVKLNTAGILAGAEVGNFLHFGNTTGSIGDLKVIKANTATAGGNAYFTISQRDIRFGRGGFDADAPASAYLAAGSEVALIRPYFVDVAGDNASAYGVAMGTVTSGNNTLVQIEGLARCKGVAATAFTDGAPVFTAAAGEVDVTDPLTAPGVTARVGFSKSAYGGANSIQVPVMLANISSKW